MEEIKELIKNAQLLVVLDEQVKALTKKRNSLSKIIAAADVDYVEALEKENNKLKEELNEYKTKFDDYSDFVEMLEKKRREWYEDY